MKDMSLLEVLVVSVFFCVVIVLMCHVGAKWYDDRHAVATRPATTPAQLAR